MHILPVSIDDKSYEIILSGKRVEGTIGIDLTIMLGNLNAFNRKSRLPGYVKDKLIKKLPWGWVKESQARIKVHGSFPKDFGTAEVMGMLDEHTRQAKDALMDREIINFV